jgi:hypothetical protein
MSTTRSGKSSENSMFPTSSHNNKEKLQLSMNLKKLAFGAFSTKLGGGGYSGGGCCSTRSTSTEV